MHFQANAQVLLCEYIGAMDVYRSDMDALSTVTWNRHIIHKYAFNLLAVELEKHEDRYHLPRI